MTQAHLDASTRDMYSFLDEFPDVFGTADETEVGEEITPSEANSLLNTPVNTPEPEPYDPTVVTVVDPRFPSPAHQELDDEPEPCSSTKTSSTDPIERQVWGARSRREIFEETDQMRQRVSESLVGYMGSQGRLWDSNEEQSLAHSGRMDFMEIESMRVNPVYQSAPLIRKIVVVTKTTVDISSAFETTYPLLLSTPISLNSFFKRFREGAPQVEHFVLSCFRRRLRLTLGSARLFTKCFGRIDYDNIMVNLFLETAGGTKLSFGLAQEDPARLQFGTRYQAGSEITIIVHATLQGHYSFVQPDKLEETITELYKMDVRTFNKSRNAVLQLLKEGAPVQRAPTARTHVFKRRHRRHRN